MSAIGDKVGCCSLPRVLCDFLLGFLRVGGLKQGLTKLLHQLTLFSWTVAISQVSEADMSLPWALRMHSDCRYTKHACLHAAGDCTICSAVSRSSCTGPVWQMFVALLMACMCAILGAVTVTAGPQDITSGKHRLGAVAGPHGAIRDCRPESAGRHLSMF